MGRAVALGLAGVALTLVAFTFDASPLFVPGLAFILLAVAAPAFVILSSRGASVERRLHSDRVVEGEPLEATLEVRRGRFGLPGAEVLDPLARIPVSLSAPLSVLRGARTVQVRVVTRFPRRGLVRLAPPCVIVSDSLELARTGRPGCSPAQELLVLPRTEPLRSTATERVGESPHPRNRSLKDLLDAVNVDGLRPYRLGTPASRIHWQALARGAGLLERRLLADGEARPLVVLDARGTGPDELLDAAVRAAASLALELARIGGCRLLLPGERRPIAIEADLASWPVAHARLALVEGGPETRAPVLGGGAPRGPLFYVAVQALDRAPAPRAAMLVLPKELSGATVVSPSFEVAGCYGFAVGVRSVWSQVQAA